ncbi:hypothetical protein CHARACLAT_020981 [Characodon lateralis]|uniref:Uncharacterized protein n=1 Tax=Characodon lateralis TaxID=208331 RepID=A0ABU7F5F0_9TELE|nr:hypothetical protein [Characodon lateralis]
MTLPRNPQPSTEAPESLAFICQPALQTSSFGSQTSVCFPHIGTSVGAQPYIKLWYCTIKLPPGSQLPLQIIHREQLNFESSPSINFSPQHRLKYQPNRLIYTTA